MAAFEDGSKLVQRIRDQRAKPGREPLPEAPTNDLLDSLTLGPMLVRGHYDHDVKRFGEQYTCGDSQAREQMKDVLINLQMRLIIALRTVMMDEMELDFDALQTASDDGRVNTGVCLGQLSQRLSSNLQAQAHYPTHRVSSYASSSTSASALTLPVSSSLRYANSRSTQSSVTFPSPPKSESLPDRTKSVVIQLPSPLSPSPPPPASLSASRPPSSASAPSSEPQEEHEQEQEPLQIEAVEPSHVSTSEEVPAVEGEGILSESVPETSVDQSSAVALDQPSPDEMDMENAKRKSTHVLASDDRSMLLLFPQPGGHPILTTALEKTPEEDEVTPKHKEPETQARWTHRSTGSRDRFSPDDYQDENMNNDDSQYSKKAGRHYSPSIKTNGSQYSHSTIYDMYHQQQQQQPQQPQQQPPPATASPEVERSLSGISSSSSSSASSSRSSRAQSTPTKSVTSHSSGPLNHSSPEYVRYLQENSRPPRAQASFESPTPADKQRGKKILGKFHAAPQDIPYRPPGRLPRHVAVNPPHPPPDNVDKAVVVTTAAPPKNGGWHIHPPSRSSSSRPHQAVAAAVEVDAPHRHIYKNSPSPYGPPRRPLPPTPPPALPYVAASASASALASASASVPNFHHPNMSRPFSPTSNPLPALDFELDLGLDLNLNLSTTTTRPTSATQAFPFPDPHPPPPPTIPPPPRPDGTSVPRKRSHSTAATTTSRSSSSVQTTVTAVATPMPVNTEYPLTLPSEHNLLGFCKGAFRLQIGLATKAFVPANRPVGYASMIPYWRCSKCNFEGPVHMSTVMVPGSDRGKIRKKKQQNQHQQQQQQPSWRPVKEFDPKIRIARSITSGMNWDGGGSNMNGHGHGHGHNGEVVAPIAVRYKWAFLAKCHVPLKGMVPFDTVQGHMGEVGSFACIFCAVEGRARGWVTDPAAETNNRNGHDKDHDHDHDQDHDDGINRDSNGSASDMTFSSSTSSSADVPTPINNGSTSGTPKSKSRIRTKISLMKIGRSRETKHAAAVEADEETSSIPIPPIPPLPPPSTTRPSTRPTTATSISKSNMNSGSNSTMNMNMTPTFGNVASFMAHLDQVHRREDGWPNPEVQARFHCVVGRVAGAEVEEEGWEINLMPLELDSRF